MPILKVKPDPAYVPRLKVKPDTDTQTPPDRSAPPPEHDEPRTTQTGEKPQRHRGGANGKAFAKPVDIHRTPPHSVEAEQGVLGSVLTHCQYQHNFDVLREVSSWVQPWFFYVPAHKTIYEVLMSLYKENIQVDLILFTQIMRDRKLLDSVGGASFITSLFTFVPTAANVMYYVDILRDKFILRESIAVGTRVVRAAYGAEDDEAAELLSDFSVQIDRLKAHAGMRNGVKPLSSADLQAMHGQPDPNNLIGTRWQCRGGNCLWSGGSGYGKSTLMAQFAATWATGNPCFGIRPIKPLRSLILQAENDDFDVSEQYNGVLSGMELSQEDVDLIGQNVTYVRVEAKSGHMFLIELERMLNLYRPDLAWIDPLFAFAGCDLMNAEKTGYFLREGLFPLFVKFNCCGNIIHHISKPPKEEKSDKATIDYQYSAFGSSEIQNAFRAVNTVHPINFAEQIYKLVFSKRGRRARAKNMDGGLTSQIFIQQSDDASKICWTQVEEPEKPSKKPNALKYTEDDILEYMSVAVGWKISRLQKHIREEGGMQSSTFYFYWNKMKKEAKKIRCDQDGLWYKKMRSTDETPTTPI